MSKIWWLHFVVGVVGFLETVSYYVAQAGLEILESPAIASRVDGIADVYHCTWSDFM